MIEAFPGLGAAMEGAAATTCEPDRTELLAAADTIRAVSEEAPLRLVVTPGTIQLSVHSADGDATIPLSCDVEGERSTRSVSFRNFRLACQSLDFQRLRICIADTPHEIVRIDGSDEHSAGTWVLALRNG